MANGSVPWGDATGPVLTAPAPPSRAPAAPPAARLGAWLTLLCVTLLGYALTGKGWAYVGVPPLFIGEMVLGAGVVAAALYGRWDGLLRLPPMWALLALMTWGALRTLPEIPVYGADALRDAVVWGYGVFALIVFAMIRAEPGRLGVLVRDYGRFCRWFLAGVPAVWFAYRFFGESLPRWPWVDVPILFPKGGDVMVHCAGVLAFWAAGLGAPGRPVWLVLLAGTAMLVGSYDRAGFLSFVAAFGVSLALNPGDRTLRRLMVAGLCGVLLLAVTGIRIQMPGREREFSFGQVVANVESLVGTSRAGDLDDTKEWRLEWWGDIYNYTIQGKYFWTGKGFGINLADDDGYQVEEDSMLRNPHNGHLTLLARGGVPGFALWLTAHLTWGWCVFGGWLRSRRAGDLARAGLFQFLLAYWAAFMVNTSFDVFIEGPMGGIWYWTLYGVGLAALAGEGTAAEVTP